jgi:hypothetical protein
MIRTRVSRAIIRTINASGFFDYIMHGDMPSGGPTSREEEPRERKRHHLDHHCCPACSSTEVVLLTLGSECVWKCATHGCPVPARQFVTVGSDAQR